MSQEEIMPRCLKCGSRRIRYRESKNPHFKCDFCGNEWNNNEGE